MHKCAHDDADLVIDGQPYRIENLWEFARINHLHYMRGVTFCDYGTTRERLEAEYAAMKAELAQID